MNNEMEDKWQCPDCMKINSVNMCSCGYVKVDFNSEQSGNVEEKAKQPIWKNKKVLVGVAIVLVAIVMIFVGKKIYDKNNPNYLDCVIVNENYPNGAVFGMTFADIKPIIGRELSIGDLNSSSGGWYVAGEGNGNTYYEIISSGGRHAVGVMVNRNGNVIMVSMRTTITSRTYYGDVEITAFSKAYGQMIGATTDSVKQIFTDLYKRTLTTDSFADYGRGVLFGVVYENGVYSFNITAMSQDVFEERYMD